MLRKSCRASRKKHRGVDAHSAALLADTYGKKGRQRGLKVVREEMDMRE